MRQGEKGRDEDSVGESRWGREAGKGGEGGEVKALNLIRGESIIFRLMLSGSRRIRLECVGKGESGLWG